jgi:hypothetical protein
MLKVVVFDKRKNEYIYYNKEEKYLPPKAYSVIAISKLLALRAAAVAAAIVGRSGPCDGRRSHRTEDA